jgi:type IV pilus assembly protein PilX
MNARLGRKQRGMALISALLLLLVVTIMAISMFRSFGTQEKIAGNVREKQRALNAAVSAEQYAEQFLASGNAPSTSACSGFVLAATGQVCNSGSMPPDFTALPWTAGIWFTPFTSNPVNGVLNTVNTTPTGGQGTAESYYQTPTYFITDLGFSPIAGGTGGEVYQIDALGYGGTANAVAVVESTFLISNNLPRGPDK